MKRIEKRISREAVKEISPSLESESSKRVSHLSRRTLLVVLFLVASVVGVYWQMIHHDFVTYDDGAYVYENPMVQSGLNWKSILWAFTTGTQANWHPLTWLSHMLDSQLYGLKPGLHHFTSLLLHVINTVLLFLVFRRMTGLPAGGRFGLQARLSPKDVAGQAGAFWASAFVAAFFGLHPLHVESVAWASERKDVLSTLFWMLTMLMYIRYVEKPEWKRYALVALFFALGLMAKPMLITLPFVLLLLDFWPLKRFEIGGDTATALEPAAEVSEKINGRGKVILRLLKEKAPLFALSLISSVVTFVVQQRGGAVLPLERIPIAIRLGNAIVSYAAYIREMVWPSHLAFFYPHPGYALSVLSVILAAVLLLLLTAVFLRFGRSHHYLITGWFWYLGTLVPVVGIVQVGIQAMADRYTYVPLIGLSVIIAWGIQELLGNWRYKKLAVAGSSGALFLTLMTLTWFQVGTWRDSESLFSHAVAATERNYLALADLGITEARKGKINEAIAHYTEALRIGQNLWDIHNQLGMALASAGRYSEATSHYSEAIRIRPDYPEAHYNLGIMLERQGKTEEAISHFREVLKFRPDDAEAHNNLGASLGKQGKIDEAIEHFSEAVRIRPDYPSAQYNLGTALMRQGKYEEAITHLSAVVRLKPDHANAHYNLGLALEKIGRNSEAIAQFMEATSINPKHQDARNELAKLMLPQNQLKRDSSAR